MSKAKTLTDAELKRVLHVIKGSNRYAQRDTAMILLSHWCGLRVGEISALSVSDVVNESGDIRTEIRLSAEDTKTNMARTVFVPEKMQRVLREYVMERGKRRSSFLFVTQKSQRFSANTATQLLGRIYKKAGIEGARSHSGRRTFITQLAAKGVSVRVLAALAGHRSIQTTQNYIDVNDDMLRNAVELV
jgi:integrase/recombinase XerD